MTSIPSAEDLWISAASFADSALEAFHAENHARAALDAGTSLEHLAKACLARRSPTLLAELRTGPAGWPSLAALAGCSEAKPSFVRTVGLRDALVRMQMFVTSPASDADLKLLVDLRDGVVHAALTDAVEERLLVAFLQHTDALLVDLGRTRADHWGVHLEAVDSLLADATDKVAHRVKAKLAGAAAAFAKRHGGLTKEVLDLMALMPPPFDVLEAALVVCPGCEFQAVALGRHLVEVDGEYDEEGIPHVVAWVEFEPTELSCWGCGLRLASTAELAQAGVVSSWPLPNLDPARYADPYEGADYGFASEDEPQ
jgi:hypothetical protein